MDRKRHLGLAGNDHADHGHDDKHYGEGNAKVKKRLLYATATAIERAFSTKDIAQSTPFGLQEQKHDQGDRYQELDDI
jgi:hypothetical protein